MQINKRIQASLLVAIFAIAIASAVLPVYAVTIIVTPSTAYVGSTITISGQATPLALVEIYMDNVKIATIGAGIHGDFSTPLEVPERPYGNRTIATYDTAADKWAYATLTIVPNVIPKPTKGAPSSLSGLTVTLKGTGYHAGSTVTFRFDTVMLGTAVTNDNGTCTLDFQVPDHAEATVNITGTDAEGAVGSAPFDVIPDIKVEPNTGNGVATSVKITGAGFAASGLIHASTIVFINTHTGDSINASHSEIAIDTVGNFIATSILLPRLTAGLYDVTMSEKAGHIHKFVGKYIVYPVIILTPSYGGPGDTIKVEGFGFGKTLGVSISFDNVAVTTSTTDDSGYFSATFVVPVSFLGGHYVKAVDDESNSASASFSIGPKISISPKTGTVGPTTTVDANGVVSGSIFSSSHTYSEVTVNGLNYKGSYGKPMVVDKTLGTTVTVSGVGFSANSFVNVTVRIMSYDSYKEKFGTYDLLVVSNVQTDAKGTFTAPFVFPTASSDSYLVSAVDLRFQSAVDNFTVVPGMIIDPPVVVGPSLEKIIATGFPVTTKNWVYNFLINGTDALYGTDLQAVTQWRFDGNGTLRGSQLVSEVEPAIPGFILPILEPALYQITIISGGRSASDNVIVMNVVNTLSDMNAKIDSINGTVVTIKTDVGTINTNVASINAVVTSINGTVATISTTVGTINTNVASINAVVTSINGTVATISTTVGTIQTSVSAINPIVTSIQSGVATIQTDIGTIKGTVVSTDGKVATIQTDVGTLQADVSGVKTDVANIPSQTSTPIWIAVVLSLIAAAAACYAVITIRRKIAG